MNSAQSLDQLRTDLALIDAATAQLMSSMDSLTDTDIAQPSLLPGWTVGHCLTHIARNADGIGNLVTWAVTGEHTPMYSSMDARNADIDAGAARSAAEHRDDVRMSAQALAHNLQQLIDAGPHAWSTLVLFGAPPAGTAPDTPASAVPYARLREVVIHHADLGLPTFGPTDFDDEFVRRTIAFIEARAGGADVLGPPSDVLWWRLGRAIPSSVTDVDGNAPGSPPAW
jgi:maleylpyruvate isomerase